MTIHFEDVTKQKREDAVYLTFALVLAIEGIGVVKTKGWRYYPSTGTIQGPSMNKGGRWISTQWITDNLYKRVEQEAHDYFVAHEFCEDPWESPWIAESKKRNKSSKQLTQEEWNEQQLNKLERKKHERKD